MLRSSRKINICMAAKQDNLQKQDLSQKRLDLSNAYLDYQKLLKSRAHIKIHDHSIGDGLVQETFLKTWKYLVKGGKIDIMKAFLFHVLNDLIVDEYRKNKPTSLDVLLEKGFEPKAINSDNLLKDLDGKSAMLLIARLPLKYQKIMRMKYVQDLSLEEMSRVTGESKNTLAVNAHRGLEKLKKIYNR